MESGVCFVRLALYLCSVPTNSCKGFIRSMFRDIRNNTLGVEVMEAGEQRDSALC